MHYVGRANCYDSDVAKYEIFKNKINYEKIQLIPVSKAPIKWWLIVL